MRQNSFFSIEDTFFGAILGAILGVFVERLSWEYVALLIGFFVVFPLILRRVERISRRFQTLIFLLGFGWMSVLMLDLNFQSLIPFFNNGLIFLGIFLGWLVSLFTRLAAK